MLSNESLITILLPAMISGAIALFINWRIHRDMDGVGWWPVGTALSIAGAALLEVDTHLSLGADTILTGILIVGGQFIVVFGVCRFAGKPMFTIGTATTLAGFVLVTGYYTWIGPSLAGRTAAFSAALVASFALQAPALTSVGRREGFQGVAILAFMYVVSAALLVWRAVVLVATQSSSVVDFHAASFRGTGPLNQTTIFVAATALFTLRAYGYILLSTNRVQSLLKQTATVDVLTGAPNRRAFDEELRRLAPRVVRDRITFGLGIIDVDHFKRVNDTYGHAAGDAILKNVVKVAHSVLRDSDFFARIGGEEFVLVVADTAPPAFRQAAERIRVALENSSITWGGTTLRVTASMGLAVSAAGHMNHQSLYAQADEALYKAKTGGRNRIELADAEVVDKPAALKIAQ